MLCDAAGNAKRAFRVVVAGSYGMEACMERKEQTTGQGRLQYEIVSGTAVLTGYGGRDTSVVIPESVDGFPVVWIGKKAFLSNKTLRRIGLPDSLAGIGDWAFAFCGALESVTLPYRKLEIGQGVFKECQSLSRIRNSADMEAREDIACLLAATVGLLDAFYLFTPESAGSEGWLAGFDARAATQMKLADNEGFSKMLLCGEEDCGSRDTDVGYYMEQRRRGKVRLAMLRLFHDFGLKAGFRKELEDYLLAHVKGCESEETWRVILEEHGDEKPYYELLTGLSGVTEKNFQGMMEDMGERHAEMKAYLMRYHDSLRKKEDAFAAFEL